MNAVELVQSALEEHMRFKLVSAALEACEPDPQAADALIAAWREGRAPAWLVAHLLAQVRAPAGYAVAREILMLAPGQLAESYAGPAMVHISGETARADLLAILTTGEHRRSREGAAYGLAALQDPSLADPLLAAFLAGHVRDSCAASAVASLPGAPDIALRWLLEPSREELALHVAFSLSARAGLTSALIPSVRASLDAQRVPFPAHLRQMLLERLTTSAAPSRT